MRTSDPAGRGAARPVDGLTARDHEELYRLLTEHALDFIRLHDLDGRSIYVSQSVQRLYGKVPTSLFEFAHPDDLEACKRWWQRVLVGATAERHRWRVADSGGKWHWLETEASLVQFQGRPHVLTVCRDVTEQVRAEQALRESQQHLQMVLDTLPVGVLVVDRKGDILLANPASKRIWGQAVVSGRERWAVSKGYWHDSGTRIEPNDWASVRALSHGQTSLNELIDIETFDGRKKTIENSAAPLRDIDGLIVGAAVVNQDVTQRVRAEAALRESERRLKEAEKIAHVGYWEHDFGEDRVTWSDETRRILGLAPHERARTAAALRELVHPEDRPIVDEAFARALNGQSDNDLEFRLIRPDGEVRYLHTVVDLIRGATGKPVRAFGATQDITDRKRLDDELARDRDRFRLLLDLTRGSVGRARICRGF